LSTHKNCFTKPWNSQLINVSVKFILYDLLFFFIILIFFFMRFYGKIKVSETTSHLRYYSSLNVTHIYYNIHFYVTPRYTKYYVLLLFTNISNIFFLIVKHCFFVTKVMYSLIEEVSRPSGNIVLERIDVYRPARSMCRTRILWPRMYTIINKRKSKPTDIAPSSTAPA
jgi:hypothetical protein